MFRVDLNILLTVTIVEVLDMCVSLHDNIQIISAQQLENYQHFKTGNHFIKLFSWATTVWCN